MQNMQLQYYQHPILYLIFCVRVLLIIRCVMHVMVMDYIHIYRVLHETFLITNLATTCFEVLSDNVHITGNAHERKLHTNNLGKVMAFKNSLSLSYVGSTDMLINLIIG
jgi:hypothetical protein